MTTAAEPSTDRSATAPRPGPRPSVSPQLEAELRARRERLEQRTHSETERPVAAMVIVARRGSARLGVPIEQATGFRRAVVTPLPGVPSTIVGLFQIRGSTHCCVDLLPMLTHERPSLETRAILIGMLDTPRGLLGVRFDEVLGPRTVYLDDIDHSTHSSRGAFVEMITRDLLEVIDGRRLCESPDVRIAALTLDP